MPDRVETPGYHPEDNGEPSSTRPQARQTITLVHPHLLHAWIGRLTVRAVQTLGRCTSPASTYRDPFATACATDTWRPEFAKGPDDLVVHQ